MRSVCQVKKEEIVCVSSVICGDIFIRIWYKERSYSLFGIDTINDTNAKHKTRIN